MSYCAEVKNELFALKLRRCCKEALAYGMMLCGRSFSVGRISMQTNDRKLALFYAEILQDAYGVDVRVTEGGSLRPTYKADVISEADRLKIMARFDYGIAENTIPTGLLERDCCAVAFLRGVFLACGNINDPASEYRVELLVKNAALGEELRLFLEEKGLSFKKTLRGKTTVLYTKDSAKIEDFLTLIGAPGRTLDMMNTKIFKSMKNKTNRASNCDNANIAKTVEASIRQRTAIEYLEAIGMLDSLPEELVSAAELRKRNPDAALKELCALSEEKLTVSGLNHRLAKIVEIYHEVRK